MNDNAYLTKLQAQWEQLQAEVNQNTAQVKEAAADAKIKQEMTELENQFEAATTMTEEKLKQWGSEAEAKMHEIKATFSKEQI